MGGNTTAYTYVPADNDAVSCIMTSNAACASPQSVSSDPLIVPVNPAVTPGINITATATTVCAGTSVTYTATAVNGGTSPSYQWKVNNINVGANTATYTYTPANGDVISCELISSATCVTTATATSSGITMTVSQEVTPGINITATATTVCAGTSVTYTATAVNGGTSPSYQWKVNNINVGANTATYTYTPANGDVISCELISSATCASPQTVSSIAINMTVNMPTTPEITLAVSPGMNVTEGTLLNFTGMVSGAADYTIHWYHNSVLSGTTVSPVNTFSITATPPTDTVWASLVVDGCYTDTSFNSDIMVILVSGTGIDFVKKAWGLQVYPNPAKEYITIEIQKGTIAEAFLTDVLGRKVKSIPVSGNKQKESINVSGLSAGSYYLHLKIQHSGKDILVTEKIQINSSK